MKPIKGHPSRPASYHIVYLWKRIHGESALIFNAQLTPSWQSNKSSQILALHCPHCKQSLPPAMLERNTLFVILIMSLVADSLQLIFPSKSLGLSMLNCPFCHVISALHTLCSNHRRLLAFFQYSEDHAFCFKQFSSRPSHAYSLISLSDAVSAEGSFGNLV